VLVYMFVAPSEENRGICCVPKILMTISL